MLTVRAGARPISRESDGRSVGASRLGGERVIGRRARRVRRDRSRLGRRIDSHGRRRSASYRVDIGRRRWRCSIARSGAIDDWAGRVVFFDIETTGLSGGAGTLAFLVGCGWFEDDGVPRPAVLPGRSGGRARDARRARRRLRRRVAARDVQRPDVRRAADGNALGVSSLVAARPTTCRTSTCCRRRAGSGARRRAAAATRAAR